MGLFMSSGPENYNSDTILADEGRLQLGAADSPQDSANPFETLDDSGIGAEVRTAVDLEPEDLSLPNAHFGGMHNPEVSQSAPASGDGEEEAERAAPDQVLDDAGNEPRPLDRPQPSGEEGLSEFEPSRLAPRGQDAEIQHAMSSGRTPRRDAADGEDATFLHASDGAASARPPEVRAWQPAERSAEDSPPDLMAPFAETADDGPEAATPSLSLTQDSVQENPADGQAVGQVQIEGARPNVTFTHALVEDADGRFDIDPTSGEIRVADGGRLDYETDVDHVIRVQSFGSDGQTLEQAFTIDVIDVTETISGTYAGETLSGGIGADHILGFGGADILIGNSGDDLLDGGRGGDKLIGGDGDDSLDGSSGNDALFGGDGDDTLFGGNATGNGKNTQIGGDDQLYGEFGSDTLIGGSGADSLYGGADDDYLDGGIGNDLLDGGSGHDVLAGGGGADTLVGGTGEDTASYEASAGGVKVDLEAGLGSGGDAQGDTLSEIEDLVGSSHADGLSGDAEGNRLDGGGGDDVLEGRDGDDALSGGDGDDTLTGGAGDDALYGEGGNDLFLFGDGFGADVVSGGTGWVDVIDLQGQDPGEPGAGWTLVITEGAVESNGAESLDLSEDTAGVMIFADGSEIVFDGIEAIHW